jgi:hypothetical protein
MILTKIVVKSKALTRISTLLLFVSLETIWAQSNAPVLTINGLTRAVQISASVQNLTVNPLNAARDQAWLSFITQYYQRNPNTQANLLTTTYTNYANAINNLIVSGSSITVPSQSQLLNMIVQAGSQVPIVSNSVAYAATAVQLASQVTALASSAVQNAPQVTGYAAELLTSSLQLAANQIVPVPLQMQWNTLVAGALTLADANPEFQNTYNSIITPLTQIAPGDTLAQILLNVPALQDNATLTSLLTDLDANGGVLQNPITTVVSLFNAQINQVSSAINDTMSSVQDVLQQETPDLPDYLQTTLNFDPGSLDVDLQQSTDQFVQIASTSFNLLSDVMGPIDSDFSQQIGSLGNLATTILSGANAFNPGALIGTVAEFASGDILGGLMGAFGMFGGGDGPSPAEEQLLAGQQQILQGEQDILQGEQQILTGEQTILSTMNAQFSNVDQSLNTIYQNMETGFADINSNMNAAFKAQSNQLAGIFSSLSGQLVNINSTLVQQQTGLNTFEQNVYSYALADEDGMFSTWINQYLGFQARFGIPMGTNTFTEAEPRFLTWATSYSIDDIQSPQNCSDPAAMGQTLDTVSATNNGDPAFCLNCLNVFLSDYLQVPSLTPESAIPNPHVWAAAATAYLELMWENPALFQHGPGLSSDAQTIYNLGTEIQTAVANLTYTNVNSAAGVNWPLWNAVFSFYQQQVAELAVALNESEAAFETNAVLSNPSLAATNIDLIHESTPYYAQVVSQVTNFISLWPAANGGVRAFAQMDNDSYSICRIDPTGAISTEIVITNNPLMDGVPMEANWGYFSSDCVCSYLLPVALGVSSFVSTPDGDSFITVTNVHLECTDPFCDNWQSSANYYNIIAHVAPDGNLTTYAGSDDPSYDGPLSSPLLVGVNGSQLYCVNRVASEEVASEGVETNSLAVVSNGSVSNLTILSDLPSRPAIAGPGNYGGFSFPPSLVFNNNSGQLYMVGHYDTNDVESVVQFQINDQVENSFLVPGLTVINNEETVGAFNIAGGPDGKLWIVGGGTFGTGTLWHYDPNSGQLSQWYDTPRGTSSIGYSPPWWEIFNPVLLQDGPISSTNLGGIQGTMCVDAFNELYIMCGGGSDLVRIGTPVPLQEGLFNRWAGDLLPGGGVADLPVVASLQNLDHANSLLRDLVTFGFSQSLADDDVMHSLLQGPNGLLGTSIAANLIYNQVAALAADPLPQSVLDLPTLASNRLEALQAQIISHLLDVQSRASIPTDGLVFDLLMANNQAEDISSATNPVAVFQAPQFTNYGVAEQNSLVCNDSGGLRVTNQQDLDLGTNTDFTVGFWAWMPANGDVYVGNISEGAQPEPSWWIDFNDGILTSQLQPDAGGNIVLAPYSATNFLAHQASQWFYITLVVTRQGGIAQYYINGSRIGQNPISIGTGGFGSGNIIMGGNSSAASGLLNEVSVWRRALGPSEISSIYNAGTKGSNVVAYSGTTQRNPNPAEPIPLIDTTLQNLQLLLAFHNSPPPPSLLTAQPNNGGMQLQILGEPGMSYTLQTSSNLVDWETALPYIVEGTVIQTIVLPENWTGGLDGESEETIIPSREIYETTT